MVTSNRLVCTLILIATPALMASQCQGAADVPSSPCVAQLLSTLNTDDSSKQNLSVDLQGAFSGQSPVNAGWKSGFEAHVRATFVNPAAAQQNCAVLARVTTCAIQSHSSDTVIQATLEVVNRSCNGGMTPIAGR